MATKNKHHRPTPARPAAKPAQKNGNGGKPQQPAAKPQQPAAKPAPAPEPERDEEDDDLGDDDEDVARPADAGNDDEGDEGDDLDAGDDSASGAAPGTPANGASTGEKSTNEKYKELLRSLPPAKRQGVLVGNLADRVKRQHATIATWPGDAANAANLLVEAQEKISAARIILDALPDDYKPGRARAAGGGSSSREVAVGDLVRVTDKRKAEYEDVLQAHQIVGMKVTKLRGNKVVVELRNDGDDGVMTAMFPRGHVCHDDSVNAEV